MSSGTVGDGQLVARVLRLVADHADAGVIAIDPVTFDDVPDAAAAIGIAPERVRTGAEALAEVRPEDRPVLIAHLLRVLEVGEVTDVVARPDGSFLNASLFDLRARVGALVGVSFPVATGVVADHPPPERLPARVCHVQLGPMSELLAGDRAAESMLGWRFDQREGQLSADLIHPEDRTNLVGCFISALGSPSGLARTRGRLRRSDGTWLWTEISMQHVPGDDGGHLDVELVDIANEMAAQEQLRAREQLLDRLTNALPIGVLQVDRFGRIQFTNAQVGPVTGVIGADTLTQLFEAVTMGDREPLQRAIHAVLVDGGDADLEVRLDGVDELPDRVNRLRFRALVDDHDDVAGAVVCVQDVTDEAVERALLATRATLDPLTRTLNRDAIIDELERLLDERTPTAVLFIDLDGFKRVNDTLGHSAGDRYLRVAVDRIRAALRDGDLVGRIGGDEFIAVCPGLSLPSGALLVAERVALALDEPVPGGEPVRLRASIGVALSGDDRHDTKPEDAERLLQRADRAMYASKQRGEGRPVLDER